MKKYYIKISIIFYFVCILFVFSNYTQVRGDSILTKGMNKAYQSNYQPVIWNNYFDCLEVVPTTNYFGDVNYVAKVDVSDKFEVGRHYLWFNQVHYDYEDKTGHIAVIYKAEKYLNAPVKSFSETFGLTENETKTITIDNEENYSFTYSESAEKSYSYSRENKVNNSLGVILDIFTLGVEFSITETVSNAVSLSITKSQTYSRVEKYGNTHSKTGNSPQPKFYRYEGRCEFEVYIILVFKVNYTSSEKNTYSGWGCGDWVYTYTPTGDYTLEEQNVYFKEKEATYSEMFYEYKKVSGVGYILNYELYSTPNVIYTNYF